jgi:hypothetical protein
VPSLPRQSSGLFMHFLGFEINFDLVWIAFQLKWGLQTLQFGTLRFIRHALVYYNQQHICFSRLPSFLFLIFYTFKLNLLYNLV